MTDKTHEKLAGEVGDRFCRDIAMAAARALREIPKAEREEARYFLQDKTSLFSPYIADLTEVYLKMPL